MGGLDGTRGVRLRGEGRLSRGDAQAGSQKVDYPRAAAGRQRISGRVDRRARGIDTIRRLIMKILRDRKINPAPGASYLA